MAKWTVEYKILVQNDEGVETRYAKKVIEGEDKFRALQAFFVDSTGLDFFTIRLVKEVKPKTSVKKETK